MALLRLNLIVLLILLESRIISASSKTSRSFLRDMPGAEHDLALQKWPAPIKLEAKVPLFPDNAYKTISASPFHWQVNGSSAIQASTGTGANGNASVGGSTCNGDFPCSCSSLSLQRTTVRHIDTWVPPPSFLLDTAKLITTESNTWYEELYTDFNAPRDCCLECTLHVETVRILYWPVNSQKTRAQTLSNKLKFSTISDGFTFISPSVYVAYQNLGADTNCQYLFATDLQGPLYNTTIAYNPGDLSTSRCFEGDWKAINYTEMQYPPPNSLVTDCVVVGKGYRDDSPTWGTDIVATTPALSWPPGLSLVDLSWATCEEWGLGAYDPPRMLGEATAMVPITSTTVPAAPGMPVVPNHAPATPTPSTATRQHEVPSPASLLNSPMEASAVSHSKAWPESRSQVQSALLDGDTSSNDPASKTLRPENTKSHVEDSISDNSFPSEKSIPSPNEPSRTGLISVDASTVASSRQMNAQSDFDISVANVFALMPDSTVEPAINKPNLLPTSSGGFDPVDLALSTLRPPSNVVNDVPTALQTYTRGPSRIQVINVGGQSITLSQASAEAIVGDQTATPGGPAVNVPGATVSVPTFPDPNVGSNSDANSPLAEAIYTVGGQTLVANPTGIAIQGSTIRAGQPPLTIAGTPIRLQSSGNLVIGDSTFQVSTIQASPAKADPEAAPSAQIYTINDQTLRGNPSAISVAGTTLLAGESGIDIAGTLVSLQPSGGLIIGDSTILMSPTAGVPDVATESAPALVVGGQTLHANPTSISLAGSVLTAGGSGVTIEGTRISLGTSGGLIVGDSTFPIKPIGVSRESSTTPVSPHTTGVQSTDASSTAVSLSGTMIVSDGAEITIGGTLISMKAPVDSTSSSGATLASSSGQLTQPTQTASKGSEAKLRGIGPLLKVIAGSVAALFLGCINLLLRAIPAKFVYKAI